MRFNFFIAIVILGTLFSCNNEKANRSMDNKDKSDSKLESNEIVKAVGLQGKVVLDGKLNMYLPVDFELMSKEMLSFKYHPEQDL